MVITPEINSAEKLETFPDVETEILSGTVVSSTLAGTISYEAAFDSDYETFFESPDTNCFTGLDLGEEGASILTKIRWFPAHQTTEYTNNAEFQISNAKCFLTAVWMIELPRKRLRKKRLKFVSTNSQYFMKTNFNHMKQHKSIQTHIKLLTSCAKA